MIGKPKWFQRRKYSGWGLTPKTWQGWAYIAAIIVICILIQYIPLGGLTTDENQVRIIATLIVAAIFALDIIHIMARMPNDERDRIHEAIAERNSLWVILIVLAAGIGWQAAVSAITSNVQIDPVIIAALIFGTFAKAITNIYLDKKN
jgi:hypothetical protein